ncbi:MAG: hypothetical protein WBI40_09815 [Methylococcaceae bacterium]
MYIGEFEDGEFVITIFQGKYKGNLAGASNFRENDVQKSIGTVQVLFDPRRKVVLNPNFVILTKKSLLTKTAAGLEIYGVPCRLETTTSIYQGKRVRFYNVRSDCSSS